jgi:hypothetical protein
MSQTFDTEAAAQAVPGPKYIVWDMGIWRVFTGEDIPKQPEPEQQQ